MVAAGQVIEAAAGDGMRSRQMKCGFGGVAHP